MKLSPLISLLFVSIATPGCVDVNPSGDSTSKKISDDELLDEEEYEGPYADWFELHEPFGDESFLYYKLTPAKPVPGQPVEVRVHAGSAYGPHAECEILVRTTGGSQQTEYGMIADPKSGTPWTALELEGVYVQIWNEEAEEDKEVRFAPGDAGYKQYGIDNFGHAQFVGTITPSEETPHIELRWHTPNWDNDRLMKNFADNAMEIHPRELRR